MKEEGGRVVWERPVVLSAGGDAFGLENTGFLKKTAQENVVHDGKAPRRRWRQSKQSEGGEGGRGSRGDVGEAGGLQERLVGGERLVFQLDAGTQSILRSGGGLVEVWIRPPPSPRGGGLWHGGSVG